MNLYYGIVENRNDPLKIGRCQVRIVGLHTHDKGLLPTQDLPWAHPMQPVTSAAMNGIGWTPVGPVEGTTVVLTFTDDNMQQPIMLGTLGGIPQSKAAEAAAEESGNLITDGGVVTTPSGEPVKSGDGSEVTITSASGSSTQIIDTAINSIKTKATALLGAFGIKFNPSTGVAVSAANKETLTLPVKGADDEKAPTVVPKVVNKEEAKITAQPEPAKADQKVLNAPVRLDPMPKYVKSGEEAKARECIAELVAACDKVGLTSKYAKAAILGIVGGESAWVPRDEGHVYSKADSLLNIFPSIFKGDRALAEQYSGGKKSKEEFFELIYGYKYPKGQEIGNKSPGDGGKYYGRGFNQLTGKANYKRTQDLLKKYGVDVDLVNNPELLNTNIKAAALACVLYYVDRVKHPQDDPGYFKVARERTGKDAGGGYAKKEVIYQYYLGQGVFTESTNKPAVEEVAGKKYTQEEVSYLPKEKQQALLEDRSENATVGFKDPNGKYPLRNLVNEPDTNRLARGVIRETAIAFKDQTRTVGIPGPFGASWEQPLAPFGGKYPYTKVYETESGHVQIFDDTTGHESISLYHRKGTFFDVDANGTQVNKIIGDGYTIYDRNGFIYVAGKCNLTVGNSVNIMVVGDANIEVNGTTQAIFHGQVDIGAARDVNMAIAGDFNIQTGGSFNVKTGTSVSVESATTTSIKSGTTYSVESGADASVKAAGEVYSEAAGAQHILAAGNVNVQGAEFRGQEGSAASALPVPASSVNLTAPGVTESKADSFDVLITPVRPAPPAEIKTELFEEYLKECENVEYNTEAIEAGAGTAAVKPQPKTSEDPPAIPSQGTATGDLVSFLQKQFDLAQEGYWAERAMKSGTVADSNPNIIAMWKDIGLFGCVSRPVPDGKGGFASGGDQTAWCMAFVTWCLKQNGYKWCQTARAADISAAPEKFGCIKVTEPKNGDIVHIKFNPGGNHVGFVWDVQPNGKFTILGGNQGGSGGDNNPKAGSVTKSYKNAMSVSGARNVNVIGIYRPTKEA